MPHTDVLIVGSGIAGLSVAIKVAQRFPHRKCIVITKQESVESNTRYAQGGIAVVSDLIHDSFEDHIEDTMKAGDGLCDPAVVKHVILQAPARLRELIEMGVDFDRDPSGDLMLGREGGHKANRIIHFQDVTGLNISKALLEKVKTLPNITLLSHHVAIDLITEEAVLPEGKVTCCGAYVLNLETDCIEKYIAPVTVLATGGIGQLYRTTTNPVIATGDGIAMAYRAGAKVSNMEFVQFHPTALFDANTNPGFLISEAVRGQGAYLRNIAGERFMFQYHADGELACRDVVSRAIATEILINNGHSVFLDCTHIPEEELLNHFPNIYRKCLSIGIDIKQDLIPVAPAAHYLCGGIDVDLQSRTSLQNLYACGECSNTGLHGANRLASNSLLEATVFAHNCFLDIEKYLDQIAVSSWLPESATELPGISVNSAGLFEKKTFLQNLMSEYAGIVRTNKGLHYALQQLNAWDREIQEGEKSFILSASWYELRNMIVCAKLIVEQSLGQKQNKGGFFNKDLESDQPAYLVEGSKSS
ncbi:MAG: L-aspartate oxidase [Cyclobacteriaceae bacterium]